MKKKTKSTKIYSYNVVFEPIKSGGYSVCFPDISEICTYGETLEEAREMAKDALLCYLESVQKEAREMLIKRRHGTKIERITVSV